MCAGSWKRKEKTRRKKSFFPTFGGFSAALNRAEA